MKKRVALAGYHKGRELPVVRKYYGCLHCKSLALKRLTSCFGDPEGIRSDSECLVCGGVFGCCKSSSTKISADEWEGDGPMPRPDREKVAAMRLLIVLEEKFGFHFRAREVEAANEMAGLIKSHSAMLLTSLQVMQEKLDAVGAALSGR